MATKVMYYTYKFRMYPTPDQEATLLEWERSLRFLWNCAAEERKCRLEKGVGKDRFLSYFDQAKSLTECRKEFSELKAVPADFQQYLLQCLDRSYKKHGRRTKFKSWYRRDSVAMGTNNEKKIWITHYTVGVSKLKDIKIRSHQRVKGRPVKLSFVQECGKWFVCITVDQTRPIPVHPNQSNFIGIDVGVVNTITDSNGIQHSNPRFLAKSAKRLALLQRRLAKKKRGSKNKVKATLRVAKQHQLIRRQRRNWQHNLTAKYTSDYGTIAVENLNLKNMTKSAKGTVESPGRNAKQKSGLNRSLLDVGIGEIFRQLEYKSEWKGGSVVYINPKYTSQICSSCGHKDSESRRSQSEFVCTSCGFSLNADRNAAINILMKRTDAVSEIACGDIDISQVSEAGRDNREVLNRSSNDGLY